jgi:hypothetical protein
MMVATGMLCYLSLLYIFLKEVLLSCIYVCMYVCKYMRMCVFFFIYLFFCQSFSIKECNSKEIHKKEGDIRLYSKNVLLNYALHTV